MISHTHGFVKFFLRSKFFPFRVDPFFRGTEFIDKQTGSPENCLPSKKGREIYQVYPFSLSIILFRW